MTRRHVLPLLACAPLFPGCRHHAPERIWRGVLFHNPVTIRYRSAHSLPESLWDRLQELESTFSLSDPQSELSRLNRDGNSSKASVSLLTLLKSCRQFHQSSEGIFDPTIQSYWTWLQKQNQKGQPPSEDERQKQLAMVDFSRVKIRENRIELNGTQLTLNAVAQGFATDSVTQLLQENDVESALVNLGEFRAFGESYPIEIPHPSAKKRILHSLMLTDRSLATSSGSGYRLTATGTDNHILSPTSGHSPSAHRTTTVIAPDATTADAWATILSLDPALAPKLPSACEAKFFTE